MFIRVFSFENQKIISILSTIRLTYYAPLFLIRVLSLLNSSLVSLATIDSGIAASPVLPIILLSTTLIVLFLALVLVFRRLLTLFAPFWTLSSALLRKLATMSLTLLIQVGLLRFGHLLPSLVSPLNRRWIELFLPAVLV